MQYTSGGNVLINPVELLKKVGVGAGMRVGDFGTGAAGHFALPAAQMVGDQGVIYAVDILKSVLEAVESKARFEGLANIQTVWSNLEIYGATKIQDASLDVGLLINVLFQADKDEAIVKECARMLKPGGKFLLVDWTMEAGAFGPDPAKRVDPARARQWGVDAGMEFLEQIEAGPYHFGLLFAKKSGTNQQKSASLNQ